MYYEQIIKFSNSTKQSIEPYLFRQETLFYNKQISSKGNIRKQIIFSFATPWSCSIFTSNLKM